MTRLKHRNIKTIYFITTNEDKIETARKALGYLPVEVKLKRFKTPEIQSMDLREIAEYSAKYAAEKIKAPVIVTDAGHYIPALGGFPGPFTKYVNKTLTVKDFLRLMKSVKNRRVFMKEALAYCEPGGKPVSFLVSIGAKVGFKPAGKGTIVDKTYIMDGFKKPIGAYPRETIRDYWAKHLTHYKKFAGYIGGFKN